MNAETKHSGPVDVLAVLDEAQDWLYRSSEGPGDDQRAANVKQVRGAIAELIEANRVLRRAFVIAVGDASPFAKEALRVSDAALANVGSVS
jgi:hypothetical protein